MYYSTQHLVSSKHTQVSETLLIDLGHKRLMVLMMASSTHPNYLTLLSCAFHLDCSGDNCSVHSPCVKLASLHMARAIESVLYVSVNVVYVVIICRAKTRPPNQTILVHAFYTC